MKGILALLGLGIVLGGILFFTWIGKNDQEIQLKETLLAQHQVCENHFDNMFKVISQTAQVPAEFMQQSKEAFKEIYQPLIEGRYQDKDGNQKQVLMNWVVESNPTFDMASAADLYKKIQTVVEVQRNEFTHQQDKMVDMHRQHTVFCSTFMNNTLFFMGKRLIPNCEDVSDTKTTNCIQYIESSVTEEAYKSGQENDINLFN